MAIPTLEELLTNLYRMKRECLMHIDVAEADGDLKLVRQFQMRLREINSMIQKKGGDLNA
jgi:hypothetical protein